MLDKTRKFVNDHKAEVLISVVCVGGLLIFKKKPVVNNIDKVNLELVLDDMQRKIRDIKIDILEIKETIEK